MSLESKKGGFIPSVYLKSRYLPERAKKGKSKAIGRSVIEAYMRYVD